MRSPESSDSASVLRKVTQLRSCLSHHGRSWWSSNRWPPEEQTSRSFTSVRPALREEDRKRLRDDEEVVRERPVLDVEQVQPNVLVEAEIAATADLPESRDARRHLQSV